MIPSFLLQKENITLETKAATSNLSFIDKTMNKVAVFITSSISRYDTSRKIGSLQLIDPRVKVAFLICFAVLINLLHHWGSHLIIFLMVLLFASLSRLNLVGFYKKIGLVGFFFGFLIFLPACLNIFTKGQTALTLFTFSNEHQWWIYKLPSEIAITHEGIQTVLRLTLKVMNSVSVVSLVISTTTFESMVKSLSFFKVPSVFLLTLTMSYKYIFVLSKTVEETYLALKMRWWSRGSVTEAEKLIAGRVGFLFQKSKERYELTYQSMLARGFDGSIHFYSFEKLKRIDYLFMIGNILIIISITFLNLFYGRCF